MKSLHPFRAFDRWRGVQLLCLVFVLLGPLPELLLVKPGSPRFAPHRPTVLLPFTQERQRVVWHLLGYPTQWPSLWETGKGLLSPKVVEEKKDCWDSLDSLTQVDFSEEKLRSLPMMELEALKQDLKQKLRNFHLPPPQTFAAFGQRYSLPHRADVAPAALQSHEPLRYLCGFFDGGGCVDSNLRHLKVSQSEVGGEILICFQKLFSGTICGESSGSGTRHATLQWKISGALARRAAQMLGLSRLGKRAQLLLFSQGLPAESQERQRVVRQLRELKKFPPGSGLKFESWHEVAGLLDAKGCFTLTSCGRVRLSVRQKFRGVLEALQEFLTERLPCHPTIRSDSRAQSLELLVQDRGAVAQILRMLLEHGLLLKRPQAELVLAALQGSKEDVAFARQRLREMKGWQGHFQRLDADGDERARRILGLQVELRHREKSGSEQRLPLLREKVAELREDQQREGRLREVLRMLTLLKELQQPL